jgi:pilus assembly protein CpaE
VSVPIVVVDTDPKTRARLTMQLGDDRATAVAGLDALRGAHPEGTPLVAVFGPGSSANAGMDGISEFFRSRPEAGAVVVVDELTTDILQKAMRAGVREVLEEPVDQAQLTETVDRVVAGLRPPILAPAPTAADRGRGGRVITVFSTKGGAGKSVIASNLAVALKRNHATGDVALVDADLQFGDVAVMLRLTPQHTIIDAVDAGDRLDGTMIRSLMAKHEPSGVYLLPAPIEPAFADQVSAADMSRVIAALREICEYVIVDTPAYFNDVVLGLIDESDEIVLVAGMDIPNIKNVKIGLQTLRLLNIPMSKLKLVLNRANSKVKLDVSEVERTLQLKADCLLPSDIVVPQSVNKGVPAVLDAPKSQVTKSIEEFATLIAESNPVEA